MRLDEDGAGSANSATMCILPWTHASVSVDGVWGRCCFDNTNDYDEYYQLHDRPQLALLPNSLGCIPASEFAHDNPDRIFTPSRVLDSPGMRQTRLEMLRGDQPDACRHCYWIESLGATSHRQNMNAVLAGQVNFQKLLDATGPGGELDSDLISIDLRLGNICGLTCIMCSFPTSSAFGPHANLGWSSAHIDPYRGNEVFWEDLYSLKEIKYFYFAGGEPFMQRTHLSLLDRLISDGRADEIELHYNSNLMQLPDAYLDRFPNFGRVTICASCDGVGSTFETIRRGAVWATFLKNVRIAAECVDVCLDVTVQRDNVMLLGDILDIAVSESVLARFQNILFYPPELSILSMDPRQRADAARYVTGLIERYRSGFPEAVAQELQSIYSVLSGTPAQSRGR